MQTKTQYKRGNLTFFVIAALTLVLTLALTACSGGSENTGTSNLGSNAKTEEGEGLVIPISEISETAKFYPLTVDGTRMEVVAVKASDGMIRTAFNTCQVCNGSPKAYFKQNEATLQCQNCGNQFPMDFVGLEAGGCNPVPIFDEDKIVISQTITISYDTLQENAYRFPDNWKQ